MSFTSNYLKLRAERERNSSNNAGGSGPPASSQEKPSAASTESFTSRYLALREKRSSMTISQRAEAKARTIQKKQQEESRTPAGILRNYGKNRTEPTAYGAYYSRPELGAASERLYGNITALEPVLAEKRAALDTAQASLVQAENDMKTVQGHLQQARAAYDADPTNEKANSYNQIAGAYNLAYAAYASAFDTYSVAFDAYKPYEDRLVDALTVYQLYSDQQQQAFDDWRGTIRDVGAVESEMQSVTAQIRETEQEITNLKRLTRGRSDAFGQHMKESLQNAEEKLLAINQKKALLREELDWSRYYQYRDLMQAADFAKNSRYASTANGLEPVRNNLSGMYTETGFDDLTYDYINRNKEARNKAMVNRIGDNSALLGLDNSYLEKMTDEEISIFNYLYATQGADAAYQYTAYLATDLSQRQREEQEVYWAKYAQEHPVKSSAFSVALAPIKGLSYLGQAADKAADGQIDQNAAYNKFSYAPGAIRGEVVKQIEESGKWGKVGSFAYQTGLSMADFLLATALTGNNQALTLTIMGSGAAADITISAKDRGLSDDQAFALGTVAGIAEAAMESINMETVFNPDLLKEGIGKYLLKNATAEGLEEVGTDVVNLIADILISKDQSEWQISIDNYKKQGMTESEAIARALGDQALIMASDFAGGFISGGILSGTNAGIHVNYTNRMGNELGDLDLDEEDIRAFIETGLESDPGTASYQLAVEMQDKIEAGENLSNYDLARLYQANMLAVQAEEEDAEDLRDDTAADDQADAVAGDVTDPGGLSLPSVENDTRASGFVTQSAQNGTQTQVSDTALPTGVPLSIADQRRQEQAQNGGTQYERTYEREAGPATAQPAGEPYLPGGAGISDGSPERNAGAGTAEQAGVLAGSAEQRRSAWTDRSRATVARQNYFRSLRLAKVSSLDLGLQNGTEARNIQVVPQEYWDSEMARLDDRIYNETGTHITYVMGRIQIRDNSGAVGYAKGVFTGDRIIVQADHLRIPMEQIADHEAYHAKVDFTDGRLNDEIRRHIVETFSEEQFRQVMEKYIEGLRGVIDVNETHTGAEFEAAVRQIEEEIFADAYAGINAFSAGADQFTGAVNERMDQLHMGKLRKQDNGTEEPTGPPDNTRYSQDTDSESYAGRSLINDPEVYSYGFLASQPPMKAVELPQVVDVRDTRGRIDAARIAADGIKNALSVGTERDGKVYVKNRYTGRELWVTASAIRHGLNGTANRMLTNARIGSVIGEIAQNAIPINALHNTAEGVEGTYAMAGYAFDQQGREFVTIVTVEQRTGAIAEVDVYDMTHAISGRQKRGKQADTKSQGVNPSMLASDAGSQADAKSQGINPIKDSFKVNIADLLAAVKETYRSILSEDVLGVLGETKSTDGYYTGRVRYSYAGENANNADLDALARAKEMRSAGVADETIRQQTGWHTGMDGKWRWEIDDSNMRYDGSGDLRGAESAKWAMEDYESARDDLWSHADMDTLDKVRAYNRADIAGDEATKQELYDELINGPHAYYFDQYVDAMTRARGARNAPAGGTLQDYIDHPALFEAYPQLCNVTLRFERMGGGMMGYYSRMDNEIVLNTELRYAAEDTLVHEIQHAIQKAEGFARGSNEEYWQRRQDSDDAVHVYDDKIRDSEKKVDEIMRQLPENVAEQFRRWSSLDESSKEAMDLMQEFEDGPYSDAFEDYWFLTTDLEQMNRNNYKRGPRDLYRNTAGEIEARDVTARRTLTPDQRRSQAPARGDSNTVFVEDSDELSLQRGDRYSVDDTDGQTSIGDLQVELYQLQNQRRSMLEADADYAAAAENLRYANTFTEKVAARKAMAAAAANIDTAAIDQRLADLNEQISEIRNQETRRHREDQEKYSGTKTAGYSTMPDTRLKDLDQEYMRAVQSGNRTRMAELVERAAEAAMPASVVRDKSGRLLKTYHHTGNRFTVFDRSMARTGTEMDGFFFAPDPDSTSEYGSTMITAYLNITKLAMDPKLDRKFNDSGTLLREKLAYQGYDGMARTENGEIYEYMTFDPEQIKSADPVVYDDRGRVIPLSERFNFRNPDIRYSVDDAEQDSAQQKPAPKKIRPVAESRPLIAKKDLRNTVLNLFSIPNGQRAEVGTMIDSYADRLIKNGSLTENDRKAFFDRMYDAGVMVMPADEYSAFARSHIADGRIYVSDSVKADFGDDWAEIRRRAFAAGVYLVNDKSASGIDQWNATLSAEDMLPGLFNSEETDERTILERILQVAEEGRDENLSLAEYTRRLSQQEGISEDEFLDTMERQLDWALRTFAEKARLEVHLRDHTGRKIAQERERGNQRMTLQRAREAQRRADERQARKDSARRAKERRELRELQQRTLKQLQWLSKNRNRAPEELRSTWEEVLGDIDLYAVSAADEMRWSDKYNATWKDLAQMYKDAMKNDPNFLPSKELERIVTRLDATKIADMDLGALQDLYKAAVGLRTEFYNRNNVINDEMQRLFAEVYTDAKREIEAAPGGFTGKVMDKLMNLDQLTPMNVLQHMAGWDPDGAFYSMAKQLERGERDMRAYSVKAQKMLQDFLTEHGDWVKKADGQGKDAIWYEVEVPQLLELGMGDKPIFGPTVKVYMTPAQKVHMYLESKNLDNLRHMTGGRTFVNKDLYSQGKRQEALSQGRTIKLAPETVRKLVSDLTPEEMELAKLLDRYYNTFATQEINRVSNILYGYDKAMGKNYAPIYTNKNYTKTEFGVFDTTAEGVGNLKGRQYAVNPSYNISAFDAFERHVDQTARFCGMAIPARNWTTLMNWREKNNSTGDVITHKWGEESKRYISDLITALQGGDDAKADTVSSGLSKLQSNYISAIFGANPSIVLKQLGSIPMAAAYLDARNVPTPAQISRIDRSLISKYSQDLEWRTMGYTTPETKQLKDNPNWTQSNKTFKFIFGGGAITAMDGWAASVLWPWAENKVRREHPELAMGSKAEIDSGESPFYKKVAEEFENAMSRSQSVSDEIHQSSLRKSKNPNTRAFTMFRSDSAQTYNALRQKIGEARYYMRTGAKDKVIQSAKKAAGTAFVAMLINAAWSEGVSFLMALWKNKGKYYRDDEDELTVQSVAGEMVSNMLGSFAGVVTGGEELFEVVGNIITGDTWYGIETPGMEQLTDLIKVLVESGSGMRDLMAGSWDILKNGGNLGDYFGKHSGEILGSIKDLAEAAAVYVPGLPASNLEAYLIGALKWISPELGTAYDDMFSDVGKSDLAGTEGSVLTSRIGRILDDRRISKSDDTAAALAALYEAGHKTAIPSDTPTSVSIDGEKHSLGEYRQQAYDTIWGGIVADALDDMVASDSFKEADPETQVKMLSNLYTYAAEQAKAELFDEYELDSGTEKNASIVAAGATVAECITWNTITSEMKSGEKSAELASWDIPEEAKREIFRCKISDSREDSIAAFEATGLSFDQFLRAYSMYGQINNEDLKAGMKAVEFSHWANAQGYTAEQAAVVKDELTYFNMTPASSSRYDELVGAGMDPDEAYDLTGALNELQPEDGEDEVSDLQKWRASVDFSDDVEDQLAALSAVMTDAQFLKVEIANNFGVSPNAYVTLQEIKPRYDADGNGSYKNAEIQAAIDGMSGYYSTEQKAVLWQLATGSTSARNNPYSRQVGQQVLDARAAAKEAADQEQTEAPNDSTDDDSFSQALLDQLLGRG